MPAQLFKILLVCILCHSPRELYAQEGNNFTVVYDINIKSVKKSTGIEETYNGGIKTIMLKDNKARMRLVSLMRIQSIFFTQTDSSLQKILIVKESGKKKYTSLLSPSEWNQRNAKYHGASYSFVNDSLSILGYNCKKAIITLTDGRQVNAFYSNTLKPLHHSIEPLFAGIPGLVLQYAYEEETGKITYTASQVNFKEIEDNIFAEPTKGYSGNKAGKSPAK